MKNKLNPGEGMWLWVVNRYMKGNIDAIVEEFKRAQFSYVIIKIADWARRYNEAPMKELVEKLKKNNIEPWGWQYIYGINPAQEAEVAAKFANELGLYGFVINAEKEFVNNTQKKIDASTYMTRLKQIINPSMLIGLSSYRYPHKFFINYPWREFLSGCDFYAPQVYWMKADNTAARQLTDSVADIHKMYKHFGLRTLPIRPTGAAFKEWGWVSRLDDVKAFRARAQELGFQSIDWWEAHCAYADTRDIYNYLYSVPWKAKPEPKPLPPVSPPPAVAPPRVVSGVVTADKLNVRERPTTLLSRVIGSRFRNDKVSIYDFQNNWGRIHPTESQWVSMDWVRVISSVVSLPLPLYSAKVSASALNVRDKPVTGNVLETLKHNTTVSVFQEIAGWAKVSPSEERWVSAAWLRK